MKKVLKKSNPMMVQKPKPLKKSKVTLKKSNPMLILKQLKRKNCFCSKC